MKRSEFLKEQIAWANKILANPNVRYQNGRMSHDAARQVLIESEEELEDLALNGRYAVIDGQLKFHSFVD